MTPTMEERLQRVRTALDSDALGPPLLMEQLLAHEARLGVRLPEDYRQFLLAVGHGGAGPHYGLFPIDGSDPEDVTESEQTRKPFRWTEAFNPVTWENACQQEDVWCSEDEDDQGNPQIILRVPGALYICHYGCALRFFLVVNGACYGQVWMDRQTDDAGLVPERNPDGTRMSFLDWYEQWLFQREDLGGRTLR